jgi:two-component system cell cycle response regulator DivK
MSSQRLRPAADTAPRVVVADANRDARALYGDALRPLGLEIIGVADGRDALVQCLIQPPALVLTDAWLPFVDGFALCELLRRDSMTRSVPIIILTTDISTVDLAAVERLGAISVLSKPVSVDAIVEAVEKVRDEPAMLAPPIRLMPQVVEAPSHPSIATRSFRRFETTAPATRPPSLRCPDCDRLLEFRKSRIGGVTRRNAEQWDEFHCQDCSGVFEYRHRTKKLRPIH